MKIETPHAFAKVCVGGLVLLCAACSGGLDGNENPPGFSSGGETEGQTGPSSSAAPTTATATGPATTGSTATSEPAPTSSTSSPAPTSVAETGVETETGTGEPNCLDVWTLDVDGVEGVREITLGPDNQLLAAANATDGPRLLVVDRCDGSVVDDVAAAEVDGGIAKVLGIAAGPGAVYLAGRHPMGRGVAETQTGVFAGVNLPALTEAFSEEASGSNGRDEIFDVKLGENGRLWLVGTAGSFPTEGWVISSSTTGEHCNFTVPGEGGTFGRALAIYDGTVFAFFARGGDTFVAGYDADCTCDCTPDWVADPFSTGADSTTANDVIAVGGQLYYAGWNTAPETANFEAVLGWVDVDGNLVDAIVRDITAAGDAFERIASDGDMVFVAGVTAVTDINQLQNGSATLEGYALPLGLNDTADLELGIPSLGDVTGMDVEPDGTAIYLSGAKEGAHRILRCLPDGGCA